MVTWVLKLELIAEHKPMLREHRCMWVLARGWHRENPEDGKPLDGSLLPQWCGWKQGDHLLHSPRKQGGSLVVVTHAQRAGNKLSAFFHSVDWGLGENKGRVEPLCWNFIFHMKFEMPCVWFNVKVPQVHSICTKKSSWSLWLGSEFESSCSVPLLNF